MAINSMIQAATYTCPWVRFLASSRLAALRLPGVAPSIYVSIIPLLTFSLPRFLQGAVCLNPVREEDLKKYDGDWVKLELRARWLNYSKELTPWFVCWGIIKFEFLLLSPMRDVFVKVSRSRLWLASSIGWFSLKKQWWLWKRAIKREEFGRRGGSQPYWLLW